MNRKELAAAVHAGTDGLRGMAAANAAVDVIIKSITAALAVGENLELIHSVNLYMLTGDELIWGHWKDHGTGTDTAHVVFMEQGLDKLCELRDIARDLERNVRNSWIMILAPKINYLHLKCRRTGLRP